MRSGLAGQVEHLWSNQIDLLLHGEGVELKAAPGARFAGFGVGLSMTAREGATSDIAYHATMLPILLFTLVAAWRTPQSG